MKNEYRNAIQTYEKHLNLPVRGIDASQLFLERVEGVSDPETKRKIIGKTFIDVFDEAIADEEEYKFLAQGTLYPDVIESISFKGPSATIEYYQIVGRHQGKMNLLYIYTWPDTRIR